MQNQGTSFLVPDSICPRGFSEGEHGLGWVGASRDI